MTFEKIGIDKEDTDKNTCVLCDAPVSVGVMYCVECEDLADKGLDLIQEDIENEMKGYKKHW